MFTDFIGEKNIQQGVICQFLARAGSLKTCCDVQRLHDVTRCTEIVVCVKSSGFLVNNFAITLNFFRC